MRKTLIIASVISSVVVTGPAAHASGALVAFGLQSGSEGGGQSGSARFPTRPRDPAEEAYSRGKSLVSRKISCKKCALPSGVKDVETARTVATQVRAGEFDLKDREREMVLFYLSNRFGN